jgi:hypothetical protein
MFLLYILILISAMLIITNIYTSGGFIKTEPYYKNMFNDDYLKIIGSKSCSVIIPIVNRMGGDREYRMWIAENEHDLKKLYDQNVMKAKINEMKCMDDGEVIVID